MPSQKNSDMKVHQYMPRQREFSTLTFNQDLEVVKH